LGEAERILTDTIAAAIPPADRQAVTRLLSAWRSGDSRALERLTPLIYEELRNRARRYMKHERPGHTLQATAVVHEAFVKLLDMNVPWQDRAHFFAVAARQSPIPRQAGRHHNGRARTDQHRRPYPARSAG
jgi:hypothetical protein